MQVRDTWSLRMQHCACRGIGAPWTFRGMLKYRSVEARIFNASHWDPTGIDNRDFEIRYCEFTDSVDGVFVGIGEPDGGPALLAPAARDGGTDAGLGFEKHLLLIGGELENGTTGFGQGHEDTLANAEIAFAEMGAFDRAWQAQSPLFQVLGSHVGKSTTPRSMCKITKNCQE